MQNKYKSFFLYLIFFSIIGAVSYKYKSQIKNYFIPNEKTLVLNKEVEEYPYVEVSTTQGIPYTEKISSSGVATRPFIKIISDGFHEIEFILNNNVTEVKKGTVVLKYKTIDLQVRADKLKSELELKNTMLKRASTLRKENVISQEEYDKMSLDVIHSNGELAEIQYRIDNSTKTAPFDCLIEHFNVFPESFVNNNQDILSMYSKDNVHVKVNLNLSDLEQLDNPDILNKDVALYFKNRKYKGKVIYFLKNANPFSGSVPATIEISEVDEHLTSGSVCNLKIYTSVVKKLYLIPEEAICGDESESYVFVIRKDTAYQIPIKRYKNKDGSVLVSGLEDGSLLVVSGAHRLKNMQKIRLDVQKSKITNTPNTVKKDVKDIKPKNKIEIKKGK